MAKGSKGTVKRQILDYTREGLLSFLKTLPKENISQGYWKVYQERPGRGGVGFIQSACGRAEFESEQDLEEVLNQQFIGTYGGGTYIFRLYDSHRNRIKEMPDLRVPMAGGPTITPATSSDQSSSDQVAEQLKEVQNRGRLLSANAHNAMLEKQLEKIAGGGGDDPLKLAMAEMIKGMVKKNGNGHQSSPRELLELAMVSKALREPEKDKGNEHIEKAYAGIMTAVSGLVQAQSTMSQNQMQAMQSNMNMSMNMMQQLGAFGQNDPLIVLLQQAPDLIDRIFGGASAAIREYKGAALEHAAAGAGNALANAGNGNGNQQQQTAGAPPPPPGGNRNQFLVIVYQNFKANVPPEVCADQVQYYLTDAQLRGVLNLGPEECMERLQKEGLGPAFQRDPPLRDYVYKVIIEVKRIYEEAAGKAEPEPAAAGGEGKGTTS